MNLVLIYGPPAAGKLTVATKLAERLGYKLYDNHALMTPIGNLFSYTDPKQDIARSRLGERLRLDIFSAAAEVGINFITTSARAGVNGSIYFREVRDCIRDHGGRVLFVQLCPPREVIFNRVEEPSRRGIKADTKLRLEEILEANPDLYEKFPDEDHLTISDGNISADDAATLIIDYYKLDVQKSDFTR